jgi:hypothetical protein
MVSLGSAPFGFELPEVPGVTEQPDSSGKQKIYTRVKTSVPIRGAFMVVLHRSAMIVEHPPTVVAEVNLD